MAAPRNPRAARRILAKRLRELRENAGFPLAVAAREAIESSAAKLSRVENQQQSIGPRDVRDLCQLYGVDPAETKSLMELASKSQQHGFWEEYSEIDDQDSFYIGIENDAHRLRQFEVAVIPGLLQTIEYARRYLNEVVNKGRLRPWTSNQIENILEVRRTRQQKLSPDDPASFEFTLDELVLRRGPGGLNMSPQIQHIREVSKYPNVIVRTIPIASGGHPGQQGGFTILDGLDPAPSIVCLETLAGWINVEDVSQVNRYRRLFDSINEHALAPDATLDALDRLDEVNPDRFGKANETHGSPP